MRKILESCPTCGGELEIRELHCRSCGTQIRSQYDPCPFCRLSGEEASFLELFVQAKGNMRLLEQSLGLSYPTVRHKVEAIAARMRGSHPDTPVTARIQADGQNGNQAPEETPAPPAVEAVAASAAPAPERAPRKRAGAKQK